MLLKFDELWINKIQNQNKKKSKTRGGKNKNHMSWHHKHVACGKTRKLFVQTWSLKLSCWNPAEDAEKQGRLGRVGNSVMRITATLSAFRGNFGADNYADWFSFLPCKTTRTDWLPGNRGKAVSQTQSEGLARMYRYNRRRVEMQQQHACVRARGRACVRACSTRAPPSLDWCEF